MFYEEERQKAKERQGARSDLTSNPNGLNVEKGNTQGTRTDLSPDLERSKLNGETADILAEKAGVSYSTVLRGGTAEGE